jgi:alpha/beta hydrolase family protein
MITNGAQIEPGPKSAVELVLFFEVIGTEMRTPRNWFIVGVAAVCFVAALALSHLIEPGVRVQKVRLADDTPALKFIPTGAGPHPVALLAHGYASSKEALFRYGEALAAAVFICYSVDQPGHGASPRTYTLIETAHALEAVAREVGAVDVFAGWSAERKNEESWKKPDNRNMPNWRVRQLNWSTGCPRASSQSIDSIRFS